MTEQDLHLVLAATYKEVEAKVKELVSLDVAAITLVIPNFEQQLRSGHLLTTLLHHECRSKSGLVQANGLGDKVSAGLCKSQ